MALGVARHSLTALALIGCIGGLATAPRSAHALSIELKGVAADRVDRQRSWAEGALPLPGTPNVAILDERLRQKGVSINAPLLIRIFTAESELEVWKDHLSLLVLPDLKLGLGFEDADQHRRVDRHAFLPQALVQDGHIRCAGQGQRAFRP